MTTLEKQHIDTNPMNEIYAIRQMISKQYGPSVRSISEGIRKEQRQAEEEGFVFIDLPVVRHEEEEVALA